jgi:hypothetical protein
MFNLFGTDDTDEQAPPPVRSEHTQVVLALEQSEIPDLSDDELVSAAITSAYHTGRLHEMVTGELGAAFTKQEAAIDVQHLKRVDVPIHEELRRRFADADTDDASHDRAPAADEEVA